MSVQLEVCIFPTPVVRSKITSRFVPDGSSNIEPMLGLDCGAWMYRTFALLPENSTTLKQIAGLSNEISQISTLHSSVTAQTMLMQLETYSYCRKITNHAKRHFDRATWVVQASLPMCKVSFFVFFLSRGHAHRSHRWTDFNDLYVIWRLSTQGRDFWGFCWYYLPI